MHPMVTPFLELVKNLIVSRKEFCRAGQPADMAAVTEAPPARWAAQRLWTFCGQSGAQVEAAAHLIEDMAGGGEVIDWRQRGMSARARRVEGPDA
ncbi:hypothetical protein OG563_16690 [Nocardia vinacea]|uniref:Uncharacterized protein n=1 Tax=Nocardia vinacea TaxID=96468 RepID=A0ABZ1Z6F6_9NOCA|nr:hypothetical protein [Nocardia vinacea]